MAPGVPVVEGAGSAGIVGVVQNMHTLRLELLLDQLLLFAEGQLAYGK